MRCTEGLYITKLTSCYGEVFGIAQYIGKKLNILYIQIEV